MNNNTIYKRKFFIEGGLGTMSKNGKKLLNENTIRRFMKLAEIDTLSDQFVGSLTEKYGDEDLEEGMPYNRGDEEEEEVVAEQGEPPFDMPEGEPGEEAEAEEELPPEPAEEEPPSAGGDVEAIFTDLAQALAGVAQEHGVSMDIEGGEGEEELEMGGEEDLDMAPDEGLPAEEEEGLPALEEESTEEGLVAEITRRVTARLMKESREDKVADQLAERIMARLKSTSSRE